MNRTPNLTDLTSNLTATLSAIPTTVGTNLTNAMDAAAKRLDLTGLPTVQLPKFDMPKIDMPKFDMPKFDMPKIDMPALPVDGHRVAELARDAAYIGVGAAVVVAKEVDERVRTTVRTLADALR